MTAQQTTLNLFNNFSHTLTALSENCVKWQKKYLPFHGSQCNLTSLTLLLFALNIFFFLFFSYFLYFVDYSLWLPREVKLYKNKIKKKLSIFLFNLNKLAIQRETRSSFIFHQVIFFSISTLSTFVDRLRHFGGVLYKSMAMNNIPNEYFKFFFVSAALFDFLIFFLANIHYVVHVRVYIHTNMHACFQTVRDMLGWK